MQRKARSFTGVFPAGKGGGRARDGISGSDLLAQRGRHLIGKSAGDDHAVGLSGTRPENDPEPIEIITSRTGVHHLHGTTSQAEGHGPYGASSSPVH
jgi:hypothetical protein